MEYPKQWGKTLYRTLYTGHYHHKKKIEYIKILNVNRLVLPYKINKSYKIFISYYLGSVRLIDNI